VRGGSDRFSAARANDGDPDSYWATDDGVSSGTLVLEWPGPVRLDRLVIQEAIALGQRVESWAAEAEIDGRWTPIARGTTIGYKRIATFPPLSTARVRLTVEKSRGCPAISTLAAYLAPDSR
jgi:alpha-L-fucosidase